MTINASDLMPMVFKEDLKNVMEHSYTEYIEHGGRGSCKSSFISLAIIILIISNPDYNAVIIRKTDNTLRDSVYAQMKWACEKLGVSSWFNFTTSPLQIVYKPTGQIIFFRGANDPEKLKSIKTVKGYTAITWFEELTEFTPNDLNSIKLSTMRGGEVYYLFESFNPPASERNWVNAYTREIRSNRFVHKSTYLTTPKEWLGEQFLYEAEIMQKNNERAYKNIFLGEPTGTGKNIFENITLREITDKEIASFDYTYQGIDWGYFPDPFIWCAFSYDSKTRTLYIYDELKLYKHGNKDASDKLLEYIKDKYYDGYHEERIVADSAEPKSIADFHSYGWNIHASNKFPNSVKAGMKWLQSLTAIIIDPVRCPEAADEFTLFEYDIDKKTGEIIGDFPDGQPDHAIAAARYGLETVWQRKGN